MVKRLLAHYPRRGDVPESLAEDWVRILLDQPLLSIWECYEEQIRKATKWAPTAGEFLARVKVHANNISRTERALAASIGDDQ